MATVELALNIARCVRTAQVCAPDFLRAETMPHIPTLPPDQAEPEVKAVYENFCARMQFPAPQNFILTQGPSPQIVRATWDLVRQVLVEGVPRWHKEPASSRYPGI